MTTTISENQYGLEIILTPETPKETAQLFRFTNNVKGEKPSVTLSFSTDTPYCNIHMKKISKNIQKNYISK